MNALRVALHWPCCPARLGWLGDVAALNTTHHFNYLFGHKTVEAGGGGWPFWAAQLSAQFSLFSLLFGLC